MQCRHEDRWVTLPCLVFNEVALERVLLTSNSQNVTEIVVNVINKVLLQHVGPILGFVLSIRDMKSCSYIDYWICFLTRNGVEDFKLEMWKFPSHKMPSHFFSFQNLRRLKLQNVIVRPPPTFNGFKRLTSIEFERGIFEADFFGSFFPSCPLLKELKLFCLLGFDTIDIDSPNLEIFHFKGNIKSIQFINIPCLEILVLHLYQLPERYNSSYLINVFSCLSGKIQQLICDYLVLKFLSTCKIPMSLPVTFNCLWIIELEKFSFKDLDPVACALCLIRSAPYLEELRIEMKDVINAPADTDAVVMLLKEQDNIYYHLNEPQRVDMRSISGSKSEMAFIKFILARSPVLRKLTLEPNKEGSSYKSLKTLKDLTRFCRASPTAEIIYLEQREHC